MGAGFRMADLKMEDLGFLGCCGFSDDGYDIFIAVFQACFQCCLRHAYGTNGFLWSHFR